MPYDPTSDSSASSAADAAEPDERVAVFLNDLADKTRRGLLASHAAHGLL